jgi:hypothetical protein
MRVRRQCAALCFYRGHAGDRDSHPSFYVPVCYRSEAEKRRRQQIPPEVPGDNRQVSLPRRALATVGVRDMIEADILPVVFEVENRRGKYCLCVCRSQCPSYSLLLVRRLTAIAVIGRYSIAMKPMKSLVCVCWLASRASYCARSVMSFSPNQRPAQRRKSEVRNSGALTSSIAKVSSSEAIRHLPIKEFNSVQISPNLSTKRSVFATKSCTASLTSYCINAGMRASSLLATRSIYLTIFSSSPLTTLASSSSILTSLRNTEVCRLFVQLNSRAVGKSTT